MRVSGYYYVFFFFKQKTAYELRISDWSSDVCSSDLVSLRLGFAERAGTAHQTMSLAPRLDLRQTQSLVMTPQLQQAIRLLALSHLEIEGFIAEEIEKNPQIGRESCRARVCQYV